MNFTTSTSESSSSSKANSSLFECNFISSLKFERYDTIKTFNTNHIVIISYVFSLFEMIARRLSFYKDVFFTHRIFFSFSFSFVSFSFSDSFISVSIASLLIDTFSTSIIMTYQLIDFTFVFCDIFFD